MSRLVFLGLLSVALLTAGCPSSSAPPAVSGEVHHIVLCWLKDSGNPEHRQQLVDASRKFAVIPGVTRVSAGTVVPSDRAIVDSTFDVAIVISFPDRQALADYLVHPVHKKAVEEVLKPLVEKIVVYDFEG